MQEHDEPSEIVDFMIDFNNNLLDMNMLDKLATEYYKRKNVNKPLLEDKYALGFIIINGIIHFYNNPRHIEYNSLHLYYNFLALHPIFENKRLSYNKFLN